VSALPHSILYLGPRSGTCLDRAQALRRIGCTVEHIDPRELLPATRWVDRWTWHVGGHHFGPWLKHALAQRLRGLRFDLCHVDGGEWVTPAVVALLRAHAPRVVNYNIDDPTGPRDGPRFAAYRRALPHYDLVAVVREDNLPELRALGARRALRVWRSADEVSHRPRAVSAEQRRRWASEVLFLGTWFPERGPFMVELLRRGVPLTLRGPNWHKAPDWPQLRPHWAGGAIGGDDYALAIQCARVSLGLLSHENRDQHTTRSLEIPALGGLFCAERTPEHLALYDEGSEALFWRDADECAQVCLAVLADEPRRARIAAAGHQRYLRDGHRNEAVMRRLLQAATGHDAPQAAALKEAA
jgi:hypothetical protein